MNRTACLICHCGTNIKGVIDIEKLKNDVKRIYGDILVYDNEHWCSEDGLKKMGEIIAKDEASRIVIAACTPSLHEELFKKNAEKYGLNRGFIEIANIREQASWVHWYNPGKATLKALDHILMALEAVREAKPINIIRRPTERSVLIIGGGVAGINAALNLADTGIKVFLVEKSGFLGGHMAKWDKVFPTLDCSICILGPLLSQAYNHPNIKIYTLSEVVDVSGVPGDYVVKIRRKARYIDETACNGCNKCLEVCPVELPNEYEYGVNMRKAIVKPEPQTVPVAPYIDIENCIGCMNCIGVCDPKAVNFKDIDREITLSVGAIIVATGFKPYNPREIEEYGYGRFLDVITGAEYDRMLNCNGPTKGRIVKPSDSGEVRKIAFILCVGSRSERLGRPYCSKICCMYTIKHALETKIINPEIDITVFYTDIRASGKMHEEAYRRALEAGVKFVRGRISSVERDKSGKLKLTYEDTLEGKVERELFDLVVLSIGMDPDPDNRRLANMLGLQLDEYGFFTEYHPKLKPSDTFRSGIYLAGACSGPKDITESTLQAGLAASKAAQFLHSGEVEVEVIAPEVDKDKCLKCGLCVQACDYKALKLISKEVLVNETACTGCGVCIAACPVGAIKSPKKPTDEQIYLMLKAVFKEKKDYPLIIGFLCRWCGYAAADNAGINKIPYPTNIRVVRVECSGRVSPKHVVWALKMGADGVLIIGCREQDCHYRTGRVKANRRIKSLKELLEKYEVNPGRVEITGVSASEGGKLAKIITDFVDRISKVGPIGSELVKVTTH
ncbi:MAG: hydrogenase iron-sulfur subunit [Candidatus Methanomethylicia archaeon]